MNRPQEESPKAAANCEHSRGGALAGLGYGFSSKQWVSLLISILICSMISVMAHLMHRANRKTLQAEAEAGLWDWDISITDITDRKEAEEEVVKSEIRFRELMLESRIICLGSHNG